MTHWDQIRQAARKRHDEACTDVGTEASADLLLGAVEQQTEIYRVPVSAGDPLLYGAEATLYPTMGMLVYNADVPAWRARFYQAHEFAHLWLGHSSTHCTAADLNPEALEESVPIGVQRVEGYSPQERREREANIFALEFLLPQPKLRRWYLNERRSVTAIAQQLEVPANIVLHQLTRSLLTPESPESASEPALNGELALDDSQRRAACIEQGPLLLQAGPGTGKTRTLVARVLHLLERGVPPGEILALTFSNKAAEEMRSRIAVVAPQAAPLIWIGTFHAFGLELLRKYGARLGLPPNPALVDPVDAVLALERVLPALQLHHYENLYEPAVHLRDILAAVARAKDECVNYHKYRALAEAMYTTAASATIQHQAERALEVAGVYEYYEDFLRDTQMVDFGDLISRSVELLETHPDVRDHVRRTYRQILVDEYQDVNRASARLLRAVAGAGEGLWVVGDARQAIYRFRGAAPSNMRRFTEDFPGAEVLQLEVNYRSRPAIVDVFATLTPRMRAIAGEEFTPWEARRKDSSGEVQLEIAEDEVAEGEGLAETILAQHAAGVSYREQAVLCRSHTTLSNLSRHLEEAGVPILYLGDLFERHEIRDLLALLALTAGDNNGLVRVARFAEYAVPLADVQHLLARLKEGGAALTGGLAYLDLQNELSVDGRSGLARLLTHLAALRRLPSIWERLTHYLFISSAYLQPILADPSVVGQQRRLAIYQFLQFAREQQNRFAADGGEPIAAFLRYIRRLEFFGEEKQLAQVPAEAAAIDAVRLLTVHASKGLEFDVVYLPGLGKGYFPARRQGQTCPPPLGMLPAGADDAHDEEEECLFFVALSRARKGLWLSRARRYGTQNSNSSPLLDAIASCLPRPVDGPPTWVRHTEVVTPPSQPASPHSLHIKANAVDRYLECPLRFFYDYRLRLNGVAEDTGYLQFHRCVHQVARWIEEAHLAGYHVDEEQAQEQLAVIWETDGPRGHIYEDVYRQRAEDMVNYALLHRSSATGQVIRAEWEVSLAHGNIIVQPDFAALVEDDSGLRLLLERIRTGRASEQEKEQDIYGLYYAAAAQLYPDVEPLIHAVHLSSGEVTEINLNEKQVSRRLEKYDEALAGIQAGRFAPKPSARVCPRCPYYFICPMAEGR